MKEKSKDIKALFFEIKWTCDDASLSDGEKWGKNYEFNEHISAALA
jgi:hypothetical protein